MARMFPETSFLQFKTMYALKTFKHFSQPSIPEVFGVHTYLKVLPHTNTHITFN